MKSLKQIIESLSISDLSLPEKCYKLLSKQSDIKLLDGDCGAAAYAIVKFINQISSEAVSIATIGVISSSINENGLFSGDPTVFHLFVEYDGKMFDGSGEVTIGQLQHFVLKEYGEQKNVKFYGKFKADQKLSKLVNKISPGEISWTYIYSLLENSKIEV
jgi:hypothetical protein